MELSQKLKQLRKKQGLTQLELAEKLFVSRQAITGWEAGSSKPSTKSLKSLGSLYDVSLEYLLNDDASELMGHDLNDEKENSRSINIKRRSIILVLICIGFVLTILCAVLFMNDGEQVVPMNNIEGSEVETGEDFEMEW